MRFAFGKLGGVAEAEGYPDYGTRANEPLTVVKGGCRRAKSRQARAVRKSNVERALISSNGARSPPASRRPADFDAIHHDGRRRVMTRSLCIRIRNEPRLSRSPDRMRRRRGLSRSQQRSERLRRPVRGRAVPGSTAIMSGVPGAARRLLHAEPRGAGEFVARDRDRRSGNHGRRRPTTRRAAAQLKNSYDMRRLKRSEAGDRAACHRVRMGRFRVASRCCRSYPRCRCRRHFMPRRPRYRASAYTIVFPSRRAAPSTCNRRRWRWHRRSAAQARGNGRDPPLLAATFALVFAGELV